MALRKLLSVTTLMLALSACQADRQTLGYVPDQVQPTEVEPGQDTRSTVLARLGSPSTTSVFDDDLWIYMTTTRETLSYHRPHIVNRTLVAIQFDEGDQVSDVLTYDMKAGKTINYVSRETPTRGRELGILEQLFGTIGRLPQQLPGQDRSPGE